MQVLKLAHRFRIWIAGFCVVGILIVAWLPTLIGTRWVYQPLLDRLAAQKFRVSIDAIEIGWLQPLALKGIQLGEADAATTADTNKAKSSSGSKPLLSIQSIQSNRTLFGFLLGGRNLGRFEVNQPKVDIRLLEEGTNLQRLIQAIEGTGPKTDTTAKTPPKVDVEIAIRQLEVGVHEDGTTESFVVVPPFNSTIVYQSLNQESTVTVQPTTVLKEVVITPELVRLGLARAVPLLAKSAWFDGRVSLATEAIQIPLSHPIDAVGKAMITLHEVRSGPTEPTILTVLDLIGRLTSREIPHELVFVDGSKIEISVHDQRVEHAGVRAGFPRLDERLQLESSGTVGIEDKSLDVRLAIPIPVEQLAMRDTVRKLGVPNITLPIRGTLEEPEVDWSSMRRDSSNLLALLSGTLKEESPNVSAAIGALSEVAEGNADQAIGAGIDIVKDLLKRRQEKAKEKRESASNESTDTDKAKKDEAPRKRPFRDALKNVLKGGN